MPLAIAHIQKLVKSEIELYLALIVFLNFWSPLSCVSNVSILIVAPSNLSRSSAPEGSVYKWSVFILSTSKDPFKVFSVPSVFGIKTSSRMCQQAGRSRKRTSLLNNQAKLSLESVSIQRSPGNGFRCSLIRAISIVSLT